jgi:transcriptional regulator with XRE-family HTH domain
VSGEVVGGDDVVEDRRGAAAGDVGGQVVDGVTDRLGGAVQVAGGGLGAGQPARRDERTHCLASGSTPRLLIGQRLRQLRKNKGIQTELAAVEPGVARATLWRFEKGDNRCRYKTGDVERLGRLYQRGDADRSGGVRLPDPLLRQRSDSGPFTLLDFPSDQRYGTLPTTVQLERHNEVLLLDAVDEVKPYEQRWNDIAGRALNELRSRTLILETAQRFQR